MRKLNRRTVEQRYSLDTGIETWIEADPYFPVLFIKRPDEMTNTYPMHDIDGRRYLELVEKDESLFLNDIIYNFFGDPRINNDVKLRTISQFKKIMCRLEDKIEERIYYEKRDKELME